MTPIIRFEGPHAIKIIVFFALKAYDLGPWTLRDIVVADSSFVEDSEAYDMGSF